MTDTEGAKRYMIDVTIELTAGNVSDARQAVHDALGSTPQFGRSALIDIIDWSDLDIREVEVDLPDGVTQA